MFGGPMLEHPVPEVIHTNATPDEDLTGSNSPKCEALLREHRTDFIKLHYSLTLLIEAGIITTQYYNDLMLAIKNYSGYDFIFDVADRALAQLQNRGLEIDEATSIHKEIVNTYLSYRALIEEQCKDPNQHRKQRLPPKRIRTAEVDGIPFLYNPSAVRAFSDSLTKPDS